jgi:DNA-binding response OmpR family regulator
MLKADYSQVRTVVAVDNPVIRRGLVEALKAASFKDLRETSNYSQTHKRLGEDDIDLLIAVSEMENFFVGHLVKEIRHGRLGKNPFPVVVMLLPIANQDHVRKVVDCGSDDLLLIPVAPDNLLTRLETFGRGRKSFVVTSDYIGPDRRKQLRSTGEAVPRVDVPNPIKARISNASAVAFDRDIATAAHQVNNLKIDRDGVQIRWLIEEMAKMLKSDQRDLTAIRNVASGFDACANDLIRRTKGWTDKRVRALSVETIGAAKAISAAGLSATQAQFDQLARAGAQMVQEIARTLPGRNGG